MPLQYGILQGSVLGPRIFIEYAEDVSDIFDHHAVTHHLSWSWIMSFSMNDMVRESDFQLVLEWWLNDKVIDTVNFIVACELRNIATTSQTDNGLSPVDTECVMIIHAEDRWAMLAAVDGQMQYLGSLRPHKPLTPYVIRQLLSVEGKLHLLIKPTTPQTNNSDCGVYTGSVQSERDACACAATAHEQAVNAIPWTRAAPHCMGGRRRKVIHVPVEIIVSDVMEDYCFVQGFELQSKIAIKFCRRLVGYTLSRTVWRKCF